MAMTITEALAEIKTIQKRLQKKAQVVLQYACRADHLRDPFEKEGGSAEVIRRELQSINDLEVRIVTLRTAISTANSNTAITVGSTTRTIAEWLIWRREVYPNHKGFVDKLALSLITARQQVTKRPPAAAGVEPQKEDITVNVDERTLASMQEELEEILGTLDGQLSLKNATIVFEIG